MEDNSSRFGVWRRLAFTVVPLLAIAFGSVAFFGAATTEAAASASLGVGCSASNNNGVVTVSLRFRVAASGNGSDIDSIQLTVDDGGGPVSALSVPDASVGTTFGPSTVNYPVPSVSDVSRRCELQGSVSGALTTTRWPSLCIKASEMPVFSEYGHLFFAVALNMLLATCEDVGNPLSSNSER
jgi:hypothetical protein